MKKKIINRVLIIIVFIIWGVLFYKIFHKKENKIDIYKPASKEEQVIYPMLKDTFNLEQLARDPFLGIINKSKKIILKSTPKKIRKISKKPPYIPPPKLRYLGFVRGENHPEPLVLIKINNRLHKKRLHSQIGAIYLKKIVKDTLIIRFNGNDMTIPKS